MTEPELKAAMRHGGVGPNSQRRTDDLGRYGLGLKTASLSQCRRLTVVSLKDGNLSAARWDLDEVERRDDWILLLLDLSEAQSLPAVADLFSAGHGTVVLWEVFDRAIAGETNPAAALEKLVLDCGKHLGLVFHRYLSPEFGRSLKITVNRRPVDVADPFLQRNPFTEVAGEETKTLEGHKIQIKAFILPHINNITPEELERAGGKEHLRDTQGFYVYRNRRLIISGTWFKLLGRDELTRLARIRIDIPNALDHLWGLDVKKSTATPPEAIRKILRQIIQTVADKSARVFQERRRRLPRGETVYVWERSRVRDGIRYSINRENPLVRKLAEQLSPAELTKLERALDAIELALPIRSIYVDQASNEAIDQSDPAIEESLMSMLRDLLQDVRNDSERRSIVNSLMFLEPFSAYPNATRTILETLEA